MGLSYTTVQPHLLLPLADKLTPTPQKVIPVKRVGPLLLFISRIWNISKKFNWVHFGFRITKVGEREEKAAIHLQYSYDLNTECPKIRFNWIPNKWGFGIQIVLVTWPFKIWTKSFSIHKMYKYWTIKFGFLMVTWQVGIWIPNRSSNRQVLTKYVLMISPW